MVSEFIACLKPSAAKITVDKFLFLILCLGRADVITEYTAFFKPPAAIRALHVRRLASRRADVVAVYIPLFKPLAAVRALHVRRLASRRTDVVAVFVPFFKPSAAVRALHVLHAAVDL